jgi:3-deoxy-D-manno-octulosonic-acid transferase
MAFLGGSLTAHGGASRGGQNPIEPAKLEVPVLHGPHVGNFREVYAALREAGAAVEVADREALAAALERLVDAPQERARLASAAQQCVESLTGALDRTLDALQPYMEALEQGPERPERTAAADAE